MDNQMLVQKLINAVNKITAERDWYRNKVEFLENNPGQEYQVNKPILKFEKTLIDNSDAISLLNISTELICFYEIFSKQEYIDTILDLFDIQEECRKNIEFVFNSAIYQYLKDESNEITLERFIMNLTDVFEIINKNLEDENLETIIAEYIHNTTNLELDYCEYIAPDIIDKF